MNLEYREDSYKEEVDKSIAFMGQGLDFFTEVKAQCVLDIAKRRLGAAESLRILDIGCGVGLTDRFLAGSFGSLHGVDISQTSVESAKDANPSVEYEFYDGKTLPFPADLFDMAFTINVLHHVPPVGWDHFVREMHRVLRPGGLGIIFEHNPYNPLTRLAVCRCSFDKEAVLLRRATAGGLLVKAGLRRVEARYILFFPFRSPVARIVERGMGRIPLGAQYCVVGEKRGDK